MVATILTVVGARPQFIKAAPVSHALRAHGGFDEVVVHTGQHFDDAMSEVFFKELDLPRPKHHLKINNLSHGAMTGRMLEQIESVILTERPSCVLVYGDTNSTLAGALAASKLHVPIAHVEAGLRSFNKRMPEELNRVVTDHLSSLLLCPTSASVVNLRAEGITVGVHHVGDVMYDATLAAVEKARARSRILEQLDLTPKTYAVATVHRAENTDDPVRLRCVLEWLQNASCTWPIIFPLHPRTRQRIEGFGLDLAGLRTVEPLGYLDMTLLSHHAASIYTDSGGLQKEAYFHRVPCVTLRDETEWVETVEAGWNRLWRSSATEAQGTISDYGEGHTSHSIAKLLADI
jgi:UDP-GlcNAc3NAcA epimerase